MQISEALRAYRITRKKRLHEVASAAGISVSFLSDVERGRTLPSLETCQALCNFYGISLAWLFSDVEIAAPNTACTRTAGTVPSKQGTQPDVNPVSVVGSPSRR